MKNLSLSLCSLLVVLILLAFAADLATTVVNQVIAALMGAL